MTTKVDMPLSQHQVQVVSITASSAAPHNRNCWKLNRRQSNDTHDNPNLQSCQAPAQDHPTQAVPTSCPSHVSCSITCFVGCPAPPPPQLAGSLAGWDATCWPVTTAASRAAAEHGQLNRECGVNSGVMVRTGAVTAAPNCAQVHLMEQCIPEGKRRTMQTRDREGGIWPCHNGKANCQCYWKQRGRHNQQTALSELLCKASKHTPLLCCLLHVCALQVNWSQNAIAAELATCQKFIK